MSSVDWSQPMTTSQSVRSSIQRRLVGTVGATVSELGWVVGDTGLLVEVLPARSRAWTVKEYVVAGVRWRTTALVSESHSTLAAGAPPDSTR